MPLRLLSVGIRLLALTALPLMPIFVWSADQRDRETGRLHPAGSSVMGAPQSSLMNINNLSAWYWANGIQESRPQPAGLAGLKFPRGTAYAVFAAGFFWGGRANDGTSPAIRSNGTEYLYTGWQAGAILGMRTGITEDTGAADVRIWRIRKDYATADLRAEAAEYFMVPEDSVTQSQIDSLRSQYARDWSEWPWQYGAPFYDANHDGNRGPGEDPGLAGADQVIWYVANDLVALQPWHCPPTGLELQVTIWAYNRSDALANAIFKRCRLVYKGTSSTSSNAVIDSMYFGQWSDPDIGDSYDDFAGCDTTLSLGYAYNATAVDPVYTKFGLVPPAFGYAVLQGPLVPGGSTSDTAVFDFRKVPGHRNRCMTGFIAQFGSGMIDPSPVFSYTGAIQLYQGLRGLPLSPLGPPDPSPLVDFTTGKPTYFWLNGDPVTQSGWIDGIIDIPGERRILLGSGPCTMALGDTQDLILADVGGLGATNINSISELRSNVVAVRSFFASLTQPLGVNIGSVTRPASPSLGQNYPNPFNPSTVIRYELPHASRVSLKVYNTLGQEVATLVNETKPAGAYTVNFDAGSLASGVYFYRLQAGNFVETKKLVVLR